MNDRDLETRLRDAYRAAATQTDPGALIERVHTIPTTVGPERPRWWHRLGFGALRSAGSGGIKVRGANNMFAATGITAAIAALALGGAFLAAQVEPAPQGGQQPASATGESWITVTGTQEFACGYGSCAGTSTMSDPRVEGDAEIRWSSDQRQSIDVSNYLLWGSITIANDGGTWVGQWTGFVDEEERHHITTWVQGLDAYEGLSYVEQAAQATSDGPLIATGLLYEGEAPPTVLAAGPDGSPVSE